MDDGHLNSYELLAIAIVREASRDYMKALKALKRNPGNRAAQFEKEAEERFFRSAWYMVLTDVDPEYLIRKLKEKVNYEG